ncbi:glycosyl transferase [Nodosilinea sp. LEGE 07088]|uniref:glycosyl transferase n=1 Tax=Nodosilinea sp. LEGE 07088 TaxID=2777968 RepID=UPI00187F0035|nr:glycosyl transferase [Nodosilinea sp. LEGE 07088]MBE9136556.1 glycosyl transferase [Nodosilinea sp. LEGE 07088]
MPRPTLYVSITNHGFGHATRAASLAASVKALAPDVDLVLATTAPQWLLNQYLPTVYEYRSVAVDLGVVQADSLTMDLSATLAQLQAIQARQQAIVAAESAYLKQRGITLVIADIPPLATAIAHAADVPCWMVSNFGWDFIYRSFGEAFAESADWVAACFRQCDRLFHLPFHEPMAAFPVVEEVGLTGGNPRYSSTELYQRFGLKYPRERTVLLTFGGLNLQAIPYPDLALFPDWHFLTFDQAAPELPNLIKLPKQGVRPVDVMPLCSRVVSKPGFSTFSEACRLNVPIITLTRNDFAEGPILVNGIQDHSWHQVLTPREFYQGQWHFLTQPLQPPRTSKALPTNGNEQIAQAVVNYLNLNR